MQLSFAVFLRGDFMKKRKLWQRILIALSVFSGFLAGIWLLGPVLLPFGFGFLAAGTASPVIGKLQKTGLPRWAATDPDPTRWPRRAPRHSLPPAAPPPAPAWHPSRYAPAKARRLTKNDLKLVGRAEE